MTQVTKKKRSSVTVRLPSNRRKNNAVVRKGPANTRVTRVKPSAAASVMAEPKTMVNRKEKTKPDSRPGATIDPRERRLFLGVLVAILLLAFAIVGLNSSTRHMRFELTEIKRQHSRMLKEKERLTRQIGTFKEPELIKRRALQQKMQTPEPKQIRKLP